MRKLSAYPGALPFFIAVFLNAFVDLGHKIVIQNTVFKTFDGSTQVLLTAVVNGLILLPYILLFSPAGFMSDKYPKNQVMRITAWGAVILTLMITFCYYMSLFWLAFAMTFLLAMQSAFYSPAKLGYIKVLFGKERLAQANGVAQATAIVAILAGTFLFSIVFELGYPGDGASQGEIVHALAPVGWLLVINAVIELVLVYRLPALETTDRDYHFDTKGFFTGRLAKQNLQPLARREVIRLSIIGLAMFWSVGQVMLAAFPAYAKETLGENNTIVIQGILAAAGLGIAFGSYLAGRASRDHIEIGLVPIGAAGIAVGLWLIPTLDSAAGHALNYFFVGTMGGLFIVPLTSLIQFHAGEHELGKILAANNWVQNVAMLSFLCLTAAVAYFEVKSQYLLIMIAVVGVIGGAYTVYKLPQSLTRLILNYALSSHYRIRVQGIKNIPSKGGVLLLGNHISWIDWAIVQIACPRPVRFVMAAAIYDRWYLRWLFKLVGCIPIAQGASSKDSLEHIAELLRKGQVVCLFPEGAISRTAHLGTFRQGFERACELVDEDVVILPFYLRGLWGSQFSRSSEWLKKSSQSLQRDLIVAFGQAMPKDTTADVLKRRVFDLSIKSWRAYIDELPSLGDAWIDSIKRNKLSCALADSTAAPISSRRLFAAVLAFSRRIRNTSPEQNIGLLLPTSSAGVIANMACLLAGKVLVNLNYSASQSAFTSALEQAEIKTVYSSRTFLAKLANKGFDFSAALEGVELVYLEDFKQQITKAELLSYWLASFLPRFLLKRVFCHGHDADRTAAILFSSGSEGLPKGIQLSHRNIMANLKQISDVLNTEHDDVVIASLPLFHAFGLTVTQFMPLIEGLPMVCHPDPTDALGIAKGVARYRGTILCGTSTFLRLFVRNQKVHPLMLDSLRLVVAGAEKLRPDVREQFTLKFRKDILEGYGATETTPVASVNVPDALDLNYWQVQRGSKEGTVGMPLPGSSCRIVDPISFEELPTGEDGMILIGGSQVMQGYLKDPEKTAAAVREIDGDRWYITGDKGHLDEDGYLTIVDRYSRFAKIGGEMVSLSQVEDSVARFARERDEDQADVEVVAVAVDDAKKGEKIILLADRPIDLDGMRNRMLAAGCNSLMIPDTCFQVDALPKLGSGKTDFALARQLAIELSYKSSA